MLTSQSEVFRYQADSLVDQISSLKCSEEHTFGYLKEKYSLKQLSFNGIYFLNLPTPTVIVPIYTESLEISMPN